MARAKAGPVVTDNGNFIIDAPFDEAALRKPREVLCISPRLIVSTDNLVSFS
jgi:ribose 5-phosphate isomerase